jgi:hypothetical protein
MPVGQTVPAGRQFRLQYPVAVVVLVQTAAAVPESGLGQGVVMLQLGVQCLMLEITARQACESGQWAVVSQAP